MNHNYTTRSKSHYADEPNRAKRGFTLVELMLAMAFLAFILLLTATSFVQALKTYNKGITLKRINQAGRILTEDLSRAVAGAPESEFGYNHDRGMLCIGKTMYIWNNLYDGSRTAQEPKYFSDGTPISLWRATFDSGTQCVAKMGETFSDINSVGTSRIPLLSSDARVATANIQRNQKLIEIEFTLSTHDENEWDTFLAAPSSGTNTDLLYLSPYYQGTDLTCRPAGGNFCAFADFSTTVYAPNGGE